MFTSKSSAERGQGTLEYVAIIAAAAVVAVAVILALTSQGGNLGGMAASAVCQVKSQGAGACDQPGSGESPGPDSWYCQLLGLGCSSGDGGSNKDNDDRPWYCDWFGIGCPKDDHDSSVDIPAGLDPDSEVVKTMLTTERGRQTLQWLADHHIPIVVDPNQQGAFWDGSKIVLGDGQESAATLVHEANHAKYSKEGRSADARTESRDDYVHGAIAEEVDGTVQEIQAAQEFREHGHEVDQQPGESAYTAAYDQAIKDGKSQAEAQSAGADAVSELFYNGSFVTSTTGESYPDYYGSYWDSVN
ncbi:hypothetical protein FOE78_23445 [Microlunatus elymi]|uniref:Uncharacterized protein n=1 Tax=Microlunatus elymi TaxID=2596828 RepID=A0A516Q4U2_9ACTN|nr:DUF6782 family putative metallopeptidase [Microlunatus elymi]QDP98463.1 hypothetical protein FOE78_23445 [Microlunatus elymi]